MWGRHLEFIGNNIKNYEVFFVEKKVKCSILRFPPIYKPYISLRSAIDDWIFISLFEHANLVHRCNNNKEKNIPKKVATTVPIRPFPHFKPTFNLIKLSCVFLSNFATIKPSRTFFFEFERNPLFSP